MPIINNTNYALSLAQQSLKLIADNIANAQSLGATKKVISIEPTNAGGIELQVQHAKNPWLNSIVMDAKTTSAGANVIDQSLQSVEQILTDPEHPSKSRLSDAFDSFISAASPLTANSDKVLQQTFIAKSTQLAHTVSGIMQNINTQIAKADQDLQSDIQLANQTIQQLAVLNQKVLSSHDSALDLEDKCNALLDDLVKYLPIKVHKTHQNTLEITNHDGSLTLLSGNSYMQFSYDAQSTPSSLNNNTAYNQISAKIMRDEQVCDVIDTVLERQLHNDDSSASSGTIPAHITLRDIILPKIAHTVEDFALTMVDAVNAIHNNCSPYPPKDTFTGDTLCKLSDIMQWSGKLKIAILEGNGRAPNTNSGPLRPVEIDLSRLSSRAGMATGQLTVKEVMNEINAMLSYNSGLAQEGKVSLGIINNGNGVQLPNQYLLNNIILTPTSDINNGTMSFNFEIDGNQYFGSQVDIIGVQVAPAGGGAGVAIPQENLPKRFAVEKGWHGRTVESINIPGGMVGNQNIDVTFRVIGDNGVVQTGQARFNVNIPVVGMQVTNQRFKGVAGPVAADLVVQNNVGIAPLLTTQLVTADGIAINNDDITQDGYLQLQTTSNAYRVVIDSNATCENATNRTLGQFFGLNNFFCYDEKSSNLQIRPDIAADITNLAVGQLSNRAQIEQLQVGQNAASLTLQACGPMAQTMPAVGNVVTVNGINFTFVNIPPGPANNREVAINLADITGETSMRNLAAAINAVPQTLVNATVAINGAGNVQIKFTAQNRGASGNNIMVNFVHQDMQDVTNPAIPADIAAGTVTPLQGGTNDPNPAQISSYNLTVGDASRQLFAQIVQLKEKAVSNISSGKGLITALSQPLQTQAGLVTAKIVGEITEAKKVAQIKQLRYNELNNKLSNETSIDIVQQHMEMNTWKQYFSANLAAYQQINRVMELLYRTFTG